tara:strand:+ start:192 stop:659 length:468 start_codon:yes stop_codon:yes gene_type:complete
MKKLLILLLLVPSLSWGDFNNFKKYVESLDDTIAKSITCMRYYDIFSAGVEVKIHELLLSNNEIQAKKLLQSFYSLKRRALFINLLAEKYNYIDVLDISYDLGSETDYFSEEVKAFNQPLCTENINQLMKNEKILNDTAADDAEIYINNFLNNNS